MAFAKAGRRLSSSFLYFFILSTIWLSWARAPHARHLSDPPRFARDADAFPPDERRLEARGLFDKVFGKKKPEVKSSCTVYYDPQDRLYKTTFYLHLSEYGCDDMWAWRVVEKAREDAQYAAGYPYFVGKPVRMAEEETCLVQFQSPGRDHLWRAMRDTPPQVELPECEEVDYWAPCVARPLNQPG